MGNEMIILCAKCGKEYDPDELVKVDDTEVYSCDCGYKNIWR